MDEQAGLIMTLHDSGRAEARVLRAAWVAGRYPGLFSESFDGDIQPHFCAASPLFFTHLTLAVINRHNALEHQKILS